jgi:osmotically-inducible protein OsmY
MKQRLFCKPTSWIVVCLFAAVGLLTAASGVAAKPDLNDTAITDAVEDELMIDPGVPSYAIDVATRAGVVTLTGRVGNILAKDRAGYIAETVKGVRAVVNRVEVSPALALSDQDIRKEVLQALVEDPATDSYEVQVTVNGQRVQLAGTVDSWAERELCETVAKGVKGVAAVDNLIVVDYKTPRADSEIEQDIEQRLRWNALVDDGLIEVAVTGGKVSLSGTVGSAAEKRHARADAFVAGVKAVDDSKLEVARWARDKDLRKNKYVYKDEQIRKAIKDAWMYDPRLSFFDVRADVKDGVATLRGEVGNVRAKQAAAQDARNTVGVQRVKNRIDVKPEKKLSDAEIKNRILGALTRDPLLGPYEVSVNVNSGTAALHGSVDSAYERRRAENVASGVQGVTYVDNRLNVERFEMLPYERYAYDPYPYTYRWYRPTGRHQYKSDSRLKGDIEDELWWSPYVDEEQVTVEVDSGHAHLTGSVDSWSEYQAATNNAFDAGAVGVNNDLAVVTKK